MILNPSNFIFFKISQSLFIGLSYNRDIKNYTPFLKWISVR